MGGVCWFSSSADLAFLRDVRKTRDYRQMALWAFGVHLLRRPWGNAHVALQLCVVSNAVAPSTAALSWALRKPGDSNLDVNR